jgi:hypothetical protein
MRLPEVTQDKGEVAHPPSAALTAVSWTAEGDLDLDQWVKYGGRLGAIGRAAGWWIGDWLQYGSARFGERYVRAARITRYDVQTLMNMVYVASRFEISQRREGLTWSHHAEVAALPPEERERWLDLAESERMSVRCLRDEIRRERRMVKRAKQEGAQEEADDHELVCPACGAALLQDHTTLVEAS